MDSATFFSTVIISAEKRKDYYDSASTKLAITQSLITNAHTEGRNEKEKTKQNKKNPLHSPEKKKCSLRLTEQSNHILYHHPKNGTKKDKTKQNKNPLHSYTQRVLRENKHFRHDFQMIKRVRLNSLCTSPCSLLGEEEPRAGVQACVC